MLEVLHFGQDQQGLNLLVNLLNRVIALSGYFSDIFNDITLNNLLHLQY